MGLLGPMGPGGFRRRGRRRGLVVGAAVGSAAARRSNDNSETPQQAAPSQDDQYAELEKLAKLKNDGIITEEEFTEKKKQILGL
jgi:hypothetical protein